MTVDELAQVSAQEILDEIYWTEERGFHSIEQWAHAMGWSFEEAVEVGVFTDEDEYGNTVVYVPAAVC